MAYCIDKAIEKQREKALKEIFFEHRIPIRHARVRQPNDNAHIERFNRTMRE